MLARRTDLTNKTQAHLPVSTMASNAPLCLQFFGGREPAMQATRAAETWASSASTGAHNVLIKQKNASYSCVGQDAAAAEAARRGDLRPLACLLRLRPPTKGNQGLKVRGRGLRQARTWQLFDCLWYRRIQPSLGCGRR